jgi:phage virion morphogenesis protein
MNDELTQLETWAGALLNKLGAPQRRTLARAIAVDLRRSQQQRIAAQRAPDGSDYPPRKRASGALREKRGALRRKRDAMFAKLKTARWLKATATPEGAEVGFMGRVAKLARVHQEGLEDRPAPGEKMIRYPKRQLLGFSEADRIMIREKLMDQIQRL